MPNSVFVILNYGADQWKLLSISFNPAANADIDAHEMCLNFKRTGLPPIDQPQSVYCDSVYLLENLSVKKAH